jgi:hypothetical protein
MLQHLAVDAIRIAVQFGGLFIILTIYGSMWKGAQEENQNGWVIAVIWSFAIVSIANTARIIFWPAGN